ncbi:MAG: hypothetical protein CR972_00960 [Candidatus Moraniibacteriota bacterium]|nr:MAG: hypothetical protein CR972_00960 [Candidatus Moranbacteria bacterium]
MIECNGHRYIIKNNSHIFFTCEHASQYIPEKYNNLGLSQEDLKNSKDLYDVASREMTEYLSKNLNASALYAKISRLVIDYNRKLNAATKNINTFHSCPLKTELLVEKYGTEKMIKIPENIFVKKEYFDNEERSRYQMYAVPYINSAYDVLDELRKKHKKIFIVQIHSFFPTYNGVKRDVDIAVLFDDAEETANHIIKDLQSRTNLVVAGNNPWSMKDTDGVVFEKVYDMDDVEIIAFDINNKHLTTKEGIKNISQLLLETVQTQLKVEK